VGLVERDCVGQDETALVVRERSVLSLSVQIGIF
jgi:hypothetical protein